MGYVNDFRQGRYLGYIVNVTASFISNGILYYRIKHAGISAVAQIGRYFKLVK